MPSQDSPERFSIDELSTLAGVTPRTVRYYIAEGLVDRPEGEKRGSHYLRRHLEQLLVIRRWTDAGLSLERVRELMAGAPEDPAPRRAAPGAVEVWSRVTMADGLEVHIEPGRAGLTPEQVRALVRGITALYRQVRSPDASESATRRGQRLIHLQGEQR
jgi:DNA-binding transcriptional MerR regulator